MPKSLLDLRRNNSGRVTGLPDDSLLRSQCIRLGLGVGAEIVCIERLPGGTIVVEAHRQEIALGRDLAATILVEITTPDDQD